MPERRAVRAVVSRDVDEAALAGQERSRVPAGSAVDRGLVEAVADRDGGVEGGQREVDI
jgi:hypothetical protein